MDLPSSKHIMTMNKNAPVSALHATNNTTMTRTASSAAQQHHTSSNRSINISKQMDASPFQSHYPPFPEPGSILSNRYFVLGRLGRGTFCSIHKCIDLRSTSPFGSDVPSSRSSRRLSSSSNTASLPALRKRKRHFLVAAKVELLSFANSGVLEGEAAILRHLSHTMTSDMIPAFVEHVRDESTPVSATALDPDGLGAAPVAPDGGNAAGPPPPQPKGVSAIIMEYLRGEDMHHLRDRCCQSGGSATPNRRLCASDAVYLTADIILPLLKALHDVGVVHRDVKPSNIVRVSTSGHNTRFKLVDFGLSKSFVYAQTHSMADPALPWRGVKPEGVRPSDECCQRKERSHADFRGTSMYASLRVHQFRDYSRRDDMWGLMYVFCDLVTGGLPWMHHAAARNRSECEKTKERMHAEGNEKVGEMLAAIMGKGGMERQVEALRTGFEHLGTLRFGDRPDYKLIDECIRTFAPSPPNNHNKSKGRKTEHDQDGNAISWELKPKILPSSISANSSKRRRKQLQQAAREEERVLQDLQEKPEEEWVEHDELESVVSFAHVFQMDPLPPLPTLTELTTNLSSPQSNGNISLDALIETQANSHEMLMLALKMAKVEHNAHQMILFTERERERSPKPTNNNNTPTNDRANFDKPKILTDWLAAIQQLSNEPWNSIKREKWGATSAIHDHFNDEHPNDSRNNNNPDHEDDGVDDQYGSDGNKRYKGPYKREELLSWCDRLIEAAKPFDNFMEREYFFQSSSLLSDADADDESNVRTHAVKVENDDTDASEEEGEMPDNEEEEGEIQIDTLDTVRSAPSTEEEKKDGTSPVPKKEEAPRVTQDGMDLDKMMQYAKAQHWLTFIVDNEQNKGTAPPPALSFSTSEFE